MEEGKKSKKERDAERKGKNALRKVKQNEFLKSLVNDLEGRPEEVSFVYDLSGDRVSWRELDFSAEFVLIVMK